MNYKIPLLKPHLSGDEISYIQKSFEENMLATSGENIDLFESKVQSFLTRKHVLCLNSGTSAIHLALILLGIKKGDRVICQSFSFCASSNPVKYLGATPVFVDSEKETWNMCPYFLEKAILDLNKKNKTPKAIIVTDSYGMPAKWNEILKISNRFKIPLIEDSAEALGSRYFDNRCGTFGDIGVFSFNGNKIVTASSGGAIILKSKKLINKALHFATQAKINPSQYIHNEIGYNYRMSNVLAGIGISQMNLLDTKIKLKRNLNEFYSTSIRDDSEFKIKKEPNKNFFSNFWLNAIYTESDNKKNIKNLKYKFKENNIEYRSLWYPLHLQKQYQSCSFYGTGRCLEIYNSGFVLPSSTNMSVTDKLRIKKVLNQF